MKALVIARLTFQEAFQRRVIWGVAILSLIFVVLYVFGYRLFVDDFQSLEAQQGPGASSPISNYEIAASAMELLGLYTVNFLTGIMTIFASVGAISSEIESGTLHAIVPKPIGRWEILLGKFLGFAGMLIIYIVLMVGSVVATSRIVGNYMPPNVIQGTLLIILV